MSADTENRASHRRTTYTGAEISFAGKKIGCIVRDLSARGARLETKFGTAPVPDKFELNVPKVLKQSCRVMWREGREVGVKFG
jgi:PilZ domain